MHEVARPLFKLSKLSSKEKGEKKNHRYIKFKVARLQIMLVAKQYIYVSQLFISRMPKMHAIPQLVLAPLNPLKAG